MLCVTDAGDHCTHERMGPSPDGKHVHLSDSPRPFVSCQTSFVDPDREKPQKQQVTCWVFVHQNNVWNLKNTNKPLSPGLHYNIAHRSMRIERCDNMSTAGSNRVRSTENAQKTQVILRTGLSRTLQIWQNTLQNERNPSKPAPTRRSSKLGLFVCKNPERPATKIFLRSASSNT